MECANFCGLGNNYLRYRKRLETQWRVLESSKPKPSQGEAFRRAYLRQLRRYLVRRIEPEVIEAVLRRLLPAADVVGDKYPDYVFMLDDLARHDGLRRVIIYRDCRDVTSSVLEKTRADWRDMVFVSKFLTAEKVARSWMRAIDSMEKYRSRLLAIRYEDFVRAPGGVAEVLGEYLGVEPSGFPIDLVRADRVGSYRERMSQQELDDVLSTAGLTMQRLGYI